MSSLVRALVARLRAVHPAFGAVLLVVWMALIWRLSERPPNLVTIGSPSLAWFWNFAHAPAYGALALWLAIATRARGRPLAATSRAAFWIVSFAVVHGVVDEIHQSIVPGRDASVLDVVTDLCGSWSVVAVLRAAEAAAGTRAVARTAILGVAACILAAAIATFVPDRFPEITWL
jgi:VanZ family protein